VFIFFSVLIYFFHIQIRVKIYYLTCYCCFVVRVSVGPGWETWSPKSTKKHVNWINSVKYRVHLGNGIHVSVTEGFACVDIRQYYLPYVLNDGNERPTKRGISLRLDEWRKFLNLVPAIDARNMILAKSKPCYDNNDHLGQLGFLRCGGCNPYGRNDWQ